MSGLNAATYAMTGMSSMTAQVEDRAISANFTASGSKNLYSDSADFNFGDIDFWLSAWVRSTNVSAFRHIFADVNPIPVFQLTQGSAATVRWRVYNTLGSTGATATTTDTLSLNTWHLVFAYHDASASSIGVSIDGGSFVTAAITGTIETSTNSFRIGSNNTSSWDGQIDEVYVGSGVTGGFASITPTSIRNTIFNSGAAVKYSALTSTQKSDWGLISHWPFSDSTEIIRHDFHGSNDLLNDGGVGWASGKL